MTYEELESLYLANIGQQELLDLDPQELLDKGFYNKYSPNYFAPYLTPDQ